MKSLVNDNGMMLRSEAKPRPVRDSFQPSVKPIFLAEGWVRSLSKTRPTAESSID